jgi:hypothetical protein
MSRIIVALAIGSAATVILASQAPPPTGPTPRSSLPSPAAAASRTQFLEMFARGYFPGRSGQVMVVPRQGDIITRDEPDIRYMHGSPWPYDTSIPLFFVGKNIRPGSYTVPAAQQDVAVTVASILGAVLSPAASGRVLPIVRPGVGVDARSVVSVPSATRVAIARYATVASDLRSPVNCSSASAATTTAWNSTNARPSVVGWIHPVTSTRTLATTQARLSATTAQARDGVSCAGREKKNTIAANGSSIPPAERITNAGTLKSGSRKSAAAIIAIPVAPLTAASSASRSRRVADEFKVIIEASLMVSMIDGGRSRVDYLRGNWRDATGGLSLRHDRQRTSGGRSAA